MNPYRRLFSPITINKLELKNRIVMPAMHLNYTPAGEVTDQLVAFYEERAKGGAGLMIVGGCVIDDLAGGPIFISIKDDEDIPGLSRLAEAAHRHGAALGAQLYMAGAYSHGILIGQQAVSASDHVSRFTKEAARAMSKEEIARVQDDFALAAARAKQAGMDMVEILGSAGYLICQFLSPAINKRDDEYGGDLANRMRFGLETVAKVRAKVGPDFTVGVRVAGNDFVPGSHGNAEAGQFAKACLQAGADMINVTGGWHETRVPQITQELPRAGFRYLARGIKRAVGAAPVAASNRINHPSLAEDILAAGDADLVCLGRPLLADPQFPQKASQGRERFIHRCVACNQGCFDRVPLLKPAGCMVNPAAGREYQGEPPLPSQGKRVVVVGGGPGGSEAAATAARRGGQVILLEAAEDIGGQPAWYNGPLDKKEFATIARFHAAELREAGVDVRTGITADADLVMGLDPDQVIVATGSLPAMPDIPGLDKPQVIGAWDLLAGRARAEGRVVVIGGGAVGLETAIYLAKLGALTPEQVYFLTLYQAESPEEVAELMRTGSHEVTVLEALPKLGAGIGRSTRWIVFGQLKLFGVKTRTKVKVLAVEDDGVRIEEDGKAEIVPCETVVVAAGVKPNDGLARDLSDRGVPVTLVGDAAGKRTILDAMAQGRKAGQAV